MKEEHKDYKLKSGNILRVIQDESPESPDAWGNEDMFLVYDHRDFTVKREEIDLQDIAEWHNASFRTLDYDGYWVFPVAAYIHSGISLSLTSSLKSNEWDTSVRGFILVKTKQDDEIIPEQKAKEGAEGLIEIWNQYLSGDIYGFQLLKPYNTYTITEEDLNNLRVGFDGSDSEATILVNSFLEIANKEEELEEIDSCWGFYGSDPKDNGMLDHIDDELDD